ncbi:MAG: amidohydrolase family protein [Verrucomicrobiae bacterium]|nr:amidohydrolase family protein [Verrucomicrobiae bacterium]
MKRRAFLLRSSSATAAATTPLSLIAQGGGSGSLPKPGEQPTIDVNVYLERWPFRRLPLDDSAALAAKLRESGVTQAWAASFDALLHRDLDAVNDRLAETCHEKGGASIFVPFGAVNPKLPGWRETLRRCHEVHRMRGIRLHPNYHGYTLADPAFSALLAEAEKRNLTLQIAVRMEDTRTQHPLVAAPDVDAMPLLDLLPRHKAGVRVQLLNSLRTLTDPLKISRLAALGAQFDIAMLEGTAGIERLVERKVPLAALAFGSYAPFFPIESSLLKLKESTLPAGRTVAIRCHNVENFLMRA